LKALKDSKTSSGFNIEIASECFLTYFFIETTIKDVTVMKKQSASNASNPLPMEADWNQITYGSGLGEAIY
jgi:hypothetical protein